MGVPGNANALLLKSAAAGGGAYQISRSLRFNSADSAYLSRTPSTASNRKTWTWLSWVKGPFNAASFPRILNVEGPSAGYRTAVRFTDTSQLQAYSYDGSNFQWEITTAQVFRDPSAWYHLQIAFDTTQATSSNRVKIYVNGVQVTTFASATYPSLNFEAAVNHTSSHTIGGGQPLSAYLAEIFLLDGIATDPSSFTTTDATTGQLIPKAFSGTYGTNGFHLDFADNSAATATTLGKDSAGSNNWTPNNLSVTAGAGNDSLVDVPTNGAQTDTGVGGEVRGNYCTWNPLGGSTATLSDGNLKRGGSSGNRMGTFGMSSGKWYWEIVCNTVTGGIYNGITEYSSDPSLYTLSYLYSDNGNKYVLTAVTAYGSTYGVGDVIGFAYDADNGSLVCYKNGVSQGVLINGLAGRTLFPLCRSDSSAEMVANFGQRAFAYPLSGFKALCTTNLPAPLVTKPSTVMDVLLYTGIEGNVTKPSTVFDVALDTGANILTAAQNKLSTGTDLLWIKDRANVNNHQLIDTVRGGTATLQSNTIAAETTYSAPSGSSVAWVWDAGSSTVSNTAGSITSSVRANATAGFSVVTYTGTGSVGTIGHGLGVTPGMIIVKRRDAVANWYVYHSSIGNTGALGLNLTDAKITSSAFWNNTSPTSTVLTISNASAELNANGGTYLLYCFAPVASYSAFGSYTGNGSSTDGPFVFCNFRPRFVMLKGSSFASNWHILDAARNTYNIADSFLRPNLSSQEYNGITEGSGSAIDILSNGFKLRASFADSNTNAASFVWAAFAESPFQYARAR